MPMGLPGMPSMNVGKHPLGFPREFFLEIIKIGFPKEKFWDAYSVQPVKSTLYRQTIKEGKI